MKENMETCSPTRASAPDVLGVLLTSRCNITCRHCCNDSHPQRTDVRPFHEIARIISMARDVPSIKEVGISGGEPFLFPALLLRVVQAAAAEGLTSSVTTNGFWGRAPKRNASLLCTLRDAGLRAVHISTSVFHQEFIDTRTVGGAAESALDAGLAVTINVVSTTSLDPSALRETFGDLATRVGFVVMPCLPAGRGATLVRAAEFPLEFASPPGNCHAHFKKLAVDGQGDVYPCCSPGGFTPPLRMGNVHDSSLRSILDASTRSQLLAILEDVGPHFFLPFLRASTQGRWLPARFSDQCHLCHVMLSSDACAVVVRDASAQLFAELATPDRAEAAHDAADSQRSV